MEVLMFFGFLLSPLPFLPASHPTFQATSQPSKQPGSGPANQPTGQPANQPTTQPAASQPAKQPSSQPANQPSSRAASQPTGQPANPPASHGGRVAPHALEICVKGNDSTTSKSQYELEICVYGRAGRAPCSMRTLVVNEIVASETPQHQKCVKW